MITPIYNSKENNWHWAPDMVRDGYIFNGWYRDAACTQKLPDEFAVDEITTFYAKWAPMYSYTVNKDSTATITGLRYYNPGQTEFVIPATIDQYKIKSIGANAFNSNTLIEKIILPNDIEEIKENAFYCCTNLKSINIPKAVVKIDNY